MKKGQNNNILPNIVSTLLTLNDEQIRILSDELLNNLTNTQLKEIHTSDNVKYELIEKIRLADQRMYKKEFIPLSRTDYFHKIQYNLQT